jgi:cobalamin biosynthesis protein CobD/CbiB
MDFDDGTRFAFVFWVTVIGLAVVIVYRAVSRFGFRL